MIPTKLPGWLERFDRAISGGILFRGSSVLAMVAAVAVMVLALVTFVTVVLRHTPLGGSWLTGGFEISQLSMAVVSVFAIAYCWYVGGHIRIALLRQHSRPRNQGILDAVSAFIVLIWVAAIVWAMWGVAIDSLIHGTGTIQESIPLAPFQIAFTIVMVHFALVLLRSLLGFSAKAGGRHVEHDGLY